MSYLLRHNPEGLRIDRYGFVDLDELYRKLKERFSIDKSFIYRIVEKGEKKRFEIVENKIRALYGHTIPVEIELKEDKNTKVFYHGTTSEAVFKILKSGLKPMKRLWVHLSPSVEIARDVGLRRTRKPVILKVNAEAARKDGIKFYKATDKVYLCSFVPPKYIEIVGENEESMETY
ncbi:RNA 2'-phosphotransferase [Candidatus Bathyarchaeota archaeon]|nr:RNA 2'-phosphotransferase [Candidatus Bathyarchaeota archaeon]